MKSDGTSKGRFDVVYELQKKKKKKNIAKRKYYSIHQPAWKTSIKT